MAASLRILPDLVIAFCAITTCLFTVDATVDVHVPISWYGEKAILNCWNQSHPATAVHSQRNGTIRWFIMNQTGQWIRLLPRPYLSDAISSKRRCFLIEHRPHLCHYSQGLTLEVMYTAQLLGVIYACQGAWENGANFYYNFHLDYGGDDVSHVPETENHGGPKSTAATVPFVRTSFLHKRSDSDRLTALVNQGDSLRLSCSDRTITTEERYNLEWTFFPVGALQQSSTIVQATNRYYGGPITVVWAPKFGDRSELTLEDGSIVINNVTPYETGTFRCILRTPRQHDRSWDTRVFVPPSAPQLHALTWPFIEDYQEQFECLVAAAARDTVTLQWVLNGQPDIDDSATQEQQEREDGRVRVRSVLNTRFSRDVNLNLLRCISTVVDYAGVSSSMQVERLLNVTYTYNTYVYTNTPSTRKGQPVRLVCVPSSDANPLEKLEYRWFLNGSAYGYHMMENVTDVLIIEAIVIRQAGAYTCRIRNTAGWTRQSHAVEQEVIVEVPPAKPDYINEKEVTSTTVSLTWPDASWQDTREYSYRVFYKRQGEPRYRISPSEPYLDRDYYGMNIVVNVTGLEPGSTYYFEVQSVTNTPEEGPRYSDEVVIEVLTKARPNIKLLGMDAKENLINITWRYSNPKDGYDVRLNLIVKEHNLTVFSRTVDAREELWEEDGEFKVDVEYELWAEILEGTLTETQLPILKLGDDELKMGRGAIIGIVVALLVLLILIILLVVFYRRRKKKKEEAEGRQTLSLATKMQNLGKYYDQTPRKRCPIEEDPDETEDMLDGRRNGHARHGYYDKPDILPAGDNKTDYPDGMEYDAVDLSNTSSQQGTEYAHIGKKKRPPRFVNNNPEEPGIEYAPVQKNNTRGPKVQGIKYAELGLAQNTENAKVHGKRSSTKYADVNPENLPEGDDGVDYVNVTPAKYENVPLGKGARTRFV